MKAKTFVIPETASKLRVRSPTVRWLVRSRKLACVKIGRLYFIPESAIQEFYERATLPALAAKPAENEMANAR
jgi:excisionase family DNA binding protein